MKRLLVLLLTAISLGSAARAQQPPADWIVDLNTGWLVHDGDNPAWSDPALDDTQWRRVNLSDHLKGSHAELIGEMRWYRLHFHAPADTEAKLLLGAIDGGVEVFVNGRLVGPHLGPGLTTRVEPAMVLPLRSLGDPRNLVIAIRSRAELTTDTRTEDIDVGFAGTPAAIETKAQARHGEAALGSVVSVGVFALTGVCGVLLLLLFLQQRSREYLWLGLSLICAALSGGLLYTIDSGLLPLMVNSAFGDPPTYWTIVAEVEFVYAFTGKRPGRWVRAYQFITFVVPLILDPLIALGHAPLRMLDFVESTAILPGILLILVLLFVWYRKGSREAGLLLLPMTLANVATLAFNVEDGIRSMHKDITLIPYWQWRSITFSGWQVSQSLFLLAIGIVLFQRLSRASREQALQQAELESARAVQHVMVPDELPLTPGLRIESVYKPAQHVGGDFFQILPLPKDAGTLVVLGDVSGKGVPAALNVALLIGVIRSLAETATSPARVLEALNHALSGRSSGFTTCLALHMAPSGAVTIANAGHIPPYLDGKELEVANGLALGLVDGTFYEETMLQLGSGETLTLVTDGVVEAQDPITGELFGFSRTAEISGQTAEHIAETARNFGQSDDIAVLTLQYVPVGQW